MGISCSHSDFVKYPASPSVLTPRSKYYGLLQKYKDGEHLEEQELFVLCFAPLQQNQILKGSNGLLFQVMKIYAGRVYLKLCKQVLKGEYYSEEPMIFKFNFDVMKLVYEATIDSNNNFLFSKRFQHCCIDVV